MFEYILSGFAAVFHPTTFVLMVFGIIMGIIIGAIPGLSGSMGIILLLPLVYMTMMVNAIPNMHIRMLPLIQVSTKLGKNLN